MKNFNEIILTETTDTEFKESLELTKPKSWLKTVSAFANGIGGCIFFGINDNHKVIGLSNLQQTIEKISETIKAKIEPMLIFKISPLDVEGKTILWLEIKAGTSTPYYYVNEGSKIAYVRLGNESVIAPSHILNELILKGQRLSFDAMPSKLKQTDVSFTLFEATYKQRTRTPIDKISDYLSFGLVDENGILTNAGVLLSDQCPILQSRVFCTRWNGLDKGSIFEDAIDDKEYGGNIINLLDNAVTFIKNNSKIKWKKTPNGRDDMPDYPERAVFEAIVNSLIHRDYMVIGSEIHIDMYDDRLDITSPGGMFDGKKIQEVDILQVPSSRRNPIISDVFHRLKYMERRGSGIKKILREYDNEHIPEFYSDQQYFVVKLKNKNFEKNEIVTTQKTTQKTIHKTTQKTTQKTEEILKLIKENPFISQTEISETIGNITVNGVKYHINNLKKNGLLKRIGSDKGGHWEVINCK